MNNVTTLPCET